MVLRIVRFLLAAALVMAAGACTSTEPVAQVSGTTTVPEPVRGGTLIVGTSGEVDGLNPLSSQWSGPAYQMGRAVLDPLVVMDREGNWQPYLAESITSNDDFTTWTFRLRPGITFHNGEALDAEALALFFETSTSSPLSSQGYPEKPAIAVVDDRTVTLTFSRPWSAMPAVLVEQPGYVIAPAQLESGDAAHPIGTGPFVFEEWVQGDHFRATRNPSYWRGDGLPYLDRIEFRPIADPDARLDALRAGDIDVAEANSQGEPVLAALREDGFTVVDDVDNVGVANLLMNTERAPTDDLRVRQAIVAAIDREAFRDTILDPSFEIADQPYRPGSPWHTDVDYPATDLGRARELVDEYEAEHGPIEISIMTQVVQGQVGEYLQQQLGSVGIDVRIDSLELAAFVKRFVSGDYDTVFLGGFLGSIDPDGSYPFLASSGADDDRLVKLNFARFRNDQVDAALEAQRRTDDRAERLEAWSTIWSIFAAELPYAFLTYDRTAWVTSPDVHGLDSPTTPEGVELPAINRWTPLYTQVHRSNP